MTLYCRTDTVLQRPPGGCDNVVHSLYCSADPQLLYTTCVVAVHQSRIPGNSQASDCTSQTHATAATSQTHATTATSQMHATAAIVRNISLSSERAHSSEASYLLIRQPECERPRSLKHRYLGCSEQRSEHRKQTTRTCEYNTGTSEAPHHRNQ